MAREKQPRQIHQMTIKQFEASFPNEDGFAGDVLRLGLRQLPVGCLSSLLSQPRISSGCVCCCT